MRKLKIAGLVVATVVLACGRTQNEPQLTTQAATTTVDTNVPLCTQEIDWRGATDDTQKKCSGGMEYEGRCCNFGPQAHAACAHSHEFRDYTETVTWNPIRCWCSAAAYGGTQCNVVTCSYPKCGYDTTTSSSSVAVQAILNKVNTTRTGCTATGATGTPGPAFFYSVQGNNAITGIKSAVTPDAFEFPISQFPSGRPLTCTVTVRGAPLGHDCVKNTCTTVADNVCPWGANYLYADCAGKDGQPWNGGGSTSQVNTIQWCNGASYNDGNTHTAVAKLGTAAEDLLVSDFKTTVDAMQRTDAGGNDRFRCLTGEDLANADVPTWWTSLATLSTTPPPASLSDARKTSIARKILQHRELLFETKGEFLTDPTMIAAGEALYATLDPAGSGTMVVPQTAGCGKTYSPLSIDANPTCNASAKTIVGELAMCLRLSQVDNDANGNPLTLHVDQPLMAREESKCADAAARAVALPACDTNLRLSYRQGVASIVPGALRYGFPYLPDTDPVVRKTKLQDRLSYIAATYDDLKLVESSTPRTLWDDAASLTTSLQRGAYQNSIDRVNPALGTVLPNAQHLVEGYMVDRELLDALLTKRSGAYPLKTAPALFVLADGFKAMSGRLGEVDFFHDLGCRFKPCAKVVPDPANPADPTKYTVNLVSTTTSQLHGFLGRMADPARFAAGGTPPPTDKVDTDWQVVLNEFIAGYTDVVKGAVEDTRGVSYPADPAFDDQTDVLGVPETVVPIYRFAEIVGASKVKAENYEGTPAIGTTPAKPGTGRFSGEKPNEISMGLLRAKLLGSPDQPNGSVNPLIDESQLQLTQAINAYVTSRNDLLTQQINAMEKDNQKGNVRSQLLEKGVLLKQRAQDLTGLHHAATVDAERYGNMGVAYKDAIARLEKTWRTKFVDGSCATDPQTNKCVDGPFTLSAAAAKQPVNQPITDIKTISVRPSPYKVVPDDLLLVQATGLWSPICAVEVWNRDHADTEEARLLQIHNWNITTGPQGFTITESNGVYSLHEQRQEEFDERTETESACLGGSVGVSYVGSIDLGSGSECQSSVSGNRSSTIDATGTEHRTTASFNAGLRLPNTPFPQYPVGALLAVKMRSGNASPDENGIVDVEVIQSPNTTVLVSNIFGNTEQQSSDQDIYFVVNDVTDPICQIDTTNKITVTVRHMIPIARFANQVQKAMVSTYTWFEGIVRDTILPQGRVLPTQEQMLLTEARTNLLFECAKDGPCDLSVFDQDLLQLYNQWVQYLLVQAERQVEMQKLEREVAVLAIEWESLAAQLHSLDRQSEAAWLLAAWSIRNLDTINTPNGIRENATDLMDKVDAYVWPFLVAKYPEGLYGIPNTSLNGIYNDAVLQAYLDPLTTTLKWNDEYSVPATALNTAVDRIQTDLNEAAGLLTKSTESTVLPIALMFPRPAKYYDNHVNSSYMNQYYYPVTYREVSPERALRFWDALMTTTAPLPAAMFEVTKEDLYQFFRTTDRFSNPIPQYGWQLNCNYSRPVIRAMGLYSVSEMVPDLTNQYNGNGYTVRVDAFPDMDYIGDKARTRDQDPMVAMSLVNPAWTTLTVPVTYGQKDYAWGVFDNGAPYPWNGFKPVELAAGEGLSAVGQFSVQPGARDVLDPLYDTARHAAAIMVFMEVEIRDTGSQPVWIENCCGADGNLTGCTN